MGIIDKAKSAAKQLSDKITSGGNSDQNAQAEIKSQIERWNKAAELLKKSKNLQAEYDAHKPKKPEQPERSARADFTSARLYLLLPNILGAIGAVIGFIIALPQGNILIWAVYCALFGVPSWVVGGLVSFLLLKKARRKEHKVDAKNDAKNDADYRKSLAKYEADLAKYEADTKDLQARISDADNALADYYTEEVKPWRFLPEKYNDIDVLTELLELFESRRADNLKEAINLYEELQHRRAEAEANERARQEAREEERRSRAVVEQYARQAAASQAAAASLAARQAAAAEAPADILRDEQKERKKREDEEFWKQFHGVS
jgi:chemotaxis protein histidine kinase CheA